MVLPVKNCFPDNKGYFWGMFNRQRAQILLISLLSLGLLLAAPAQAAKPKLKVITKNPVAGKVVKGKVYSASKNCRLKIGKHKVALKRKGRTASWSYTPRKAGRYSARLICSGKLKAKIKFRIAKADQRNDQPDDSSDDSSDDNRNRIYTDQQQLDNVNKLRAAAGVPALVLDAMDNIEASWGVCGTALPYPGAACPTKTSYKEACAQAANYMYLNKSFAHGQDPNKPGYTVMGDSVSNSLLSGENGLLTKVYGDSLEHISSFVSPARTTLYTATIPAVDGYGIELTCATPGGKQDPKANYMGSVYPTNNSVNNYYNNNGPTHTVGGVTYNGFGFAFYLPVIAGHKIEYLGGATMTDSNGNKIDLAQIGYHSGRGGGAFTTKTLQPLTTYTVTVPYQNNGVPAIPIKWSYSTQSVPGPDWGAPSDQFN